MKDKYSITDWQTAPPWKPLELRSKLTYGFPFRFQLERLRKFEYPLATDKFLYVATNLMLRGGYRKTHFQADATNLGNASEIGEPSRTPVQVLGYHPKTFELRFRKAKKSDERPVVFPIREIILQAAIRNHLSHEANMESFLELTNLTGFEPSSLEALGEKALPQGYVDVLLKNANPTGDSKKILIEVKLKKATTENFSQLEAYMQEVGADCGGGILVAESFGKSRPVISGIKCVRYELRGLSDTFTFDEFVSSLRFDLVS